MPVDTDNNRESPVGAARNSALQRAASVVASTIAFRDNRSPRLAGGPDYFNTFLCCCNSERNG